MVLQAVLLGQKSGADKDTLRIASEPDYPPFCIVNEKGEADGFSVDLIKASAEAMNLTVTVRIGPWSRIKKELAEGKIDALPLVGRSEEREDIFDFTFPYHTMRGAVFVRNNQKDIQEMDDLKHKSVAVMKGDNAHEYIKSNTISENIITTNTFKTAFWGLSKGKYDAVIAQHLMGLLLLQNLDIDNIKTLDIPLNNFSQDFCFAVQEGDKELLSLLNEGLSIIIANGEYDRIQTKWWSPEITKTISISEIVIILLPYLIAAFLIFLIIMVIILEIRVRQRTKRLNIEVFKHKKAEEAHRASKEKYKLMFENSPVGYQSLDIEANIIEVNKIWLNILGYQYDDVKGKNFTEFLHPDQREEFRKQFRTFIRKIKSVKGIEYKLLKSDGTSIIVEYTSRNSRDEEGNFISTHCVFQDISERKQAEERLATERQRLAITLRSIGDGVITTDMQGHIILINKVAEKLTGYNQESAVGKKISSVYQLVDEETGRTLPNPIEKIKLNSKNQDPSRHKLLISEKGNECLISDSIARIEDKNKQSIGYVLVFRDITENLKMQEIMHLNSKVESIGVLAAGIAHDFNNLFTAIFGNIELAKLINTDSTITEYLDDSLKIMDRARSLTTKLLTFSEGGSPIRKTASLPTFIKETIRSALSATDISLRMNIQADLWQCQYDKNQMRQVFENLVLNARQAMDEKGKLTLKAENITLQNHAVQKAGNYVHMAIKDNGTGIPKENLAKIFDPFFSTKFNAHGLGLSTAFSIIEKHEGFIEVNSEHGEGTTIHIYLPAAIPKKSADNKVLVNRNRETMTILVMDDEQMIRKYVEKMLKTRGYKVITTVDGAETLEQFKRDRANQQRISAMIFDLTIPGAMGGAEAIREIRKLDDKIPVFVASGYSRSQIIADPKSYGFTDSIAKPFTINQVQEMLNNYLY